MQTIKAHHYVPQFYLRGFTESPTSRLIWVYEKGSKHLFRTATQKIAFEKHFYSYPKSDGTKDSNTYETWLANAIEAPANPVLKKIRDGLMITDEEKKRLSIYMTVMLKRVPKHRERINAQAPQTIDALAKQIQSGEMPELPTEHHKTAALKILEEYQSDLPKKFMLQLTSPKVAGVLYAMTWQFLRKEDGFITGDNPVFFFEGLGMDNDYSEVTFPISNNVVLWATWRSDIKPGFIQTTEQVVEEINRRTVSTATRYVFYHAQSHEVLKLVNEPNQGFHMLR